MLIKFKVRTAFRNTLKKRRPIVQKSKIVLPNIFTAGNALFGFCSLIAANHENWFMASYLILLGALMDFMDGRVARFFGTSSEMGLQLDSLSDAVTFCLAPSFLAYIWHFKKLGFLGFLISAVFFLSGIFRLARFNVIGKNSSFFVGLPTTAASFIFIIFLILIKNTYSSIALLFLAILSIFLSYLMVSNLRIPSFKQKKIFNSGTKLK